MNVTQTNLANARADSETARLHAENRARNAGPCPECGSHDGMVEIDFWTIATHAAWAPHILHEHTWYLWPGRCVAFTPCPLCRPTDPTADAYISVSVQALIDLVDQSEIQP